MKQYYFTYGAEGMDYVGGWTVVHAPDFITACKLFSAVHPENGGCISCAGIYTEEQFENTKMFREGNYGRSCVERIEVTRYE